MIFMDEGVAATLLASSQTHLYSTKPDWSRWLMELTLDPSAKLKCSNLSSIDCAVAANWPLDYPWFKDDLLNFKVVNNSWPLNFGQLIIRQVKAVWVRFKNDRKRRVLEGSDDRALQSKLASYESYEHLSRPALSTHQVIKAVTGGRIPWVMQTKNSRAAQLDYKGPLYPTKGSIRAERQCAAAKQVRHFTFNQVQNMRAFSARLGEARRVAVYGVCFN